MDLSNGFSCKKSKINQRNIYKQVVKNKEKEKLKTLAVVMCNVPEVKITMKNTHTHTGTRTVSRNITFSLGKKREFLVQIILKK